jgi:hypothetical protein
MISGYVQYKEIFLRRYIFHIKLWNKILKPNDNIHFRQNILYNKNLNVKLSNQTGVPDFDQHLITFKFTNLTRLIKIRFLYLFQTLRNDSNTRRIEDKLHCLIHLMSLVKMIKWR